MAHQLNGLKLADAEEETLTETPLNGLDPRVYDFARAHHTELYSSSEEVPTRFRDLKTWNGPVDPYLYYVPDALSGSNFSGGSVEVSNYRMFMKEHRNTPGVYPVVGGDSSFGVAIRLNAIDDQMLQTFEALEDYAAIDDADVSRVQFEAQEEAWNDWAKSDFERALVRKYPDYRTRIARPCLRSSVSALAQSGARTAVILHSSTWPVWLMRRSRRTSFGLAVLRSGLRLPYRMTFGCITVKTPAPPKAYRTSTRSSTSITKTKMSTA